jgi:hypothetical protein
MTTKAIETILEWASQGNPHPDAEAALAELAASREAARMLDEDLPSRYDPSNPPQVIAALNLMESIGRERT